MRRAWLSLLSLAACVTAGPREVPQADGIFVRVNRIAGDTSLFSSAERVVPGAGCGCRALTVQAAVVRGDTSLAGRVWLYFSTTSTDWQFLRAHDLTLLLDGSTRIRPETGQNGEVSTGYTTAIVDEQVIAPLTPAQFQQVAAARTVEGQLGGVQFSFSAASLAGFRALAARLRTHPIANQ